MLSLVTARRKPIEDRALHLKDHIQALTAHIDQLSRKKYDEMESSPDFVMLFVSIEPAYLTAIQNDSQLWARAYAKKILLISPHEFNGGGQENAALPPGCPFTDGFCRNQSISAH